MTGAKANNDNDPVEHYTPPGMVDVSEAALAFVREFAEALSAIGTDSRLVVSIDWSSGRYVRPSPSEPEQALGPGFVLGADKRERFPPAALWSADGFQFAVFVPDDILHASRQRLIDIDPSELFKLVLR